MQRPDAGHDYNSQENFEVATPIDRIPPQFRMKAKLPNGKFQIIDKRRTYNWNVQQGLMVECGSVAGDASAEDRLFKK